MIVLDTNALVWLHTGHRRSRPLARHRSRLYVSPAAMLELQYLLEAGRIRLRGSSSLDELLEDDRWVLDDPPSATWFYGAMQLSWTRDPFDRLIVAHARLRGWRLATGDSALLARLGERERLAL